MKRRSKTIDVVGLGIDKTHQIKLFVRLIGSLKLEDRPRELGFKYNIDRFELPVQHNKEFAMSVGTKVCLDCATEIPANSKKCPNCNEWQDAQMRRQKHATRVSKNFNLHTSASAIHSLKKYGPLAVLVMTIVIAIGLVIFVYNAYLAK